MRMPHATPVLALAFVFLASMLVSQASAQIGTIRRIDRPTPVQVRAPRVRRAQASQSPAQVGPSQANPDRSNPTQTRSTPEPTPVFRDEIPESVLLTDYGTELANRLRLLRISEARMGEKHPSFELVQSEIRNVKRELEAWASIDDFELESGDKSLAERLPSMNEQDLKQLVVQLVAKIGQLEERVSKLEESRTGQ